MIGRTHSTVALLILAFIVMAYTTGQAGAVRIVKVTGETYESEKITKKLDVDNIKRIVFAATANFFGSVTIKSAAKNYQMTYIQHFKARSMEEAENFSEYISVDSERSGDRLLITARGKRNAPWQGTNQSARAKIELVLPDSIEIEVNTIFFDITISGPFTKAEVVNEFGKIKISDITETLKLEAKNSRVSLDDIRGAIDVRTSNNQLCARNIDTGDNEAEFWNEYGVIEISKFSGVLKCGTSSQSIDLRGIRLKPGRSEISTKFGSIDAEIIKLENAELSISDNFSNVELTLPDDIQAEFDLSVDRGGRIRVSGIPIIPVEMKYERLRAQTDNPESKIKVDISGIGTINVKGKKYLGVP